VYLTYYELFKDVKNKKRCYLVLEYADQGDLRDFLIDNKEHLNWEEKRRLAIQIVEGLRYLHEIQNVAHRDMVIILFNVKYVL
jgi:serine/threonine protein kinase